jgi:hypothetical protein
MRPDDRPQVTCEGWVVHRDVLADIGDDTVPSENPCLDLIRVRWAMSLLNRSRIHGLTPYLIFVFYARMADAGE